MGFNELKFRITGTAALVMHSAILSNPLSPLTKTFKTFSSKRKKTDEDFAELARLEWYGGLYLDGGKPCIPSSNIEAMLVEAARKQRKGKSALSGLFVEKNAMLDYAGPKTVDELWGDENFRLTVGARVQKNRIMRTRPIFKQWSAVVTILYDTSQFSEHEVSNLMKTGGEIVGLCDWRPKFGRFVVEVL